MRTNGFNGQNHKPHWWPRAVTWTLAHVLGRLNRYALAGSLIEASRLLSNKQKELLISLLTEHKILKPQPEEFDLEKLEHDHIDTTDEAQINAFIEGFNGDETLGKLFEMYFPGGQFSITRRLIGPLPPKELVEADDPIVSAIKDVLRTTNRPISIPVIMEELPKLAQAEITPTDISIENIGVGIGRLMEREMGKIVQTHAAEKAEPRYFLERRLYEVLEDTRTVFIYENENGKTEYIYQAEAWELSQQKKAHIVIDKNGNFIYMSANRLEQVLHKTFFEYEGEEGQMAYVHKEEAERLVAEGRAFGFLDPNGTLAYVATERHGAYLDKGFITEVKTAKSSLWVFNYDLDQLLKKGLLLTGREEGNFETCYIHHEAQRQYPYEIFNAFAFAYLDREAKGSLQKYRQLRAVFSSGLKLVKPVSIPDFLYEAKISVSMGASLNAIIIALIKHPKTVAQLRETGLFQAQEIEEIERCLSILNFISRFPLIFMPSQPDSLQNFMDFIYDKTENYEVFQLLLVTKLSQLRKLSITENKNLSIEEKELLDSLRRELRREIELVYAPLAESKGFIDLAKNMRDLVAKLVKPEDYAISCKKMETIMGMGFQQARRHLNFKRGLLLKMLLADSVYSQRLKHPIKARGRVKEAYASDKKEKTAKEDVLDYFGIRFTCETLAEAYVIIAFLQHKLERIPDEMVSSGKKAGKKPAKKVIENYLEQPNPNGWMGWRGYFYEPLTEVEEERLIKEEEEDGKGPRRTISIQVLTEEMDIDDKQGKAAHWGLKAERSSKAAADELKMKYNEQTFDRSAKDKYTGDPEEDYYIDQERARKRVRAFLWPPNQPFSPNAFKFPADGCLSSICLDKGAPIRKARETVLNKFSDFVDENTGYVELYEFYLDNNSGKIRVRSLVKGQPHVSSDFKMRNDCLMVIRDGGVPSQRGRPSQRGLLG
ncbi:MAG: hypothetical protein ABIG08_00315 [bacterium]